MVDICCETRTCVSRNENMKFLVNIHLESKEFKGQTPTLQAKMNRFILKGKMLKRWLPFNSIKTVHVDVYISTHYMFQNVLYK